MSGLIFRLKRNHVFTGRAASGIYAILKALCRDAEVVVPANICPAAVYPIVYSGNRPVFCDVECPSGNASWSSIEGRVSGRTAAVLVPHMYGNPVSDIGRIRDACDRLGLVLIEDCASSMGAQTPDGAVGSFGDYVVYSTGHAKTLDLGGGGIVASDHNLESVMRVLDKMPFQTPAGLAQEVMFGKIYRQFLNTRRPLAEFGEREFFHDDFRRVFLYRSDPAFARLATDRIEQTLQETVELRRKRWYDLSLLFKALVPGGDPYAYDEGAVPWRFSFFVPASRRQHVADALLAAGMPVSDWYPPVSSIFGDNGRYEAAESLGNSILNLPLTLGGRAKVAFEIIKAALD